MKKLVIVILGLFFVTSVSAIGLSRWIEESGKKTQTATWFVSVAQCKDLAETKCENLLRSRSYCDGRVTDIESAGVIWTTKKIGGKTKSKCRASCEGYCNVSD
jgi:hypothetical protein